MAFWRLSNAGAEMLNGLLKATSCEGGIALGLQS